LERIGSHCLFYECCLPGKKTRNFDDFLRSKILLGMMAHFAAGITPIKKRYMMTYFFVHLSKIRALIGGVVVGVAPTLHE
jgi:hypothetical protein